MMPKSARDPNWVRRADWGIAGFGYGRWVFQGQSFTSNSAVIEDFHRAAIKGGA